VYEYDLVAIGCGPGGQKAAIAAAKLGKKAALDVSNKLRAIMSFSGKSRADIPQP
jgi:pyruvate/2-oxoglutarate dehydrogenase complex dihydrolipoamide dehydrogenase (E3) component